MTKADVFTFIVNAIRWLWILIQIGYPLVTVAAWVYWWRHRWESDNGANLSLAIILTIILVIALAYAFWNSLPDAPKVNVQ